MFDKKKKMKKRIEELERQKSLLEERLLEKSRSIHAIKSKMLELYSMVNEAMVDKNQ